MEVVLALLRSPDFWEMVAESIGNNDHTYDLDDSSHRLDIVQIVCENIAKVIVP